MTALFYKKLNEFATEPRYSSASAVGLDLSAVILTEDQLRPASFRLRLEPGKRVLIKTGLSFEIPPGFYGRIAPRSGMALSSGIDVLAGVIDPDFRGEVGVILINHGEFGFGIGHGDRIAQLILERAEQLPLMPGTLSETARGHLGFGSTGITAAV